MAFKQCGFSFISITCNKKDYVLFTDFKSTHQFCDVGGGVKLPGLL